MSQYRVMFVYFVRAVTIDIHACRCYYVCLPQTDHTHAQYLLIRSIAQACYNEL